MNEYIQKLEYKYLQIQDTVISRREKRGHEVFLCRQFISTILCIAFASSFLFTLCPPVLCRVPVFYVHQRHQIPLFLFIIIPYPYLLVHNTSALLSFARRESSCSTCSFRFLHFHFSFVSSRGQARDQKYETIREHTRRLGKYFSLFTLCTSLHTMRSKWEDIDFRMTNYRQSDDEYLSVYCYTRFSNLVYDPTIPTAFFRG